MDQFLKWLWEREQSLEREIEGLAADSALAQTRAAEAGAVFDVRHVLLEFAATGKLPPTSGW